MKAAMILAAGRGERMRPLSDTTPKPLLTAGGIPLVIWQIRALARAGIETIAINVAHLGERMIDALGDGSAFGVAIRWSQETEALETAGGIATAMPLLPPGPVLIVSGDIWTTFDYARLRPRAEAIARDPRQARVHLVMVPNPSYHPRGDFVLRRRGDGSDAIAVGDGPTLTYGNIGVYDSGLFRELPRNVKIKLLPHLLEWIAAEQVTGEVFEGPWENVGTPADLALLNERLAALGESR